MDDTDSEVDGQEEGYLFTATGVSCAKCQALDGNIFAEEPERPHDTCDCDITPIAGDAKETRDCGNDYTWRWDDTERYGPRGNSFKVSVTMTVECWDGTATEIEVEMDFGNTNNDASFDQLEAMIWNTLYDQAEQAATQFCPPCADSSFRCV
jgi:hypothetical protein